jgi:hypothetical protein
MDNHYYHHHHHYHHYRYFIVIIIQCIPQTPGGHPPMFVCVCVCVRLYRTYCMYYHCAYNIQRPYILTSENLYLVLYLPAPWQGNSQKSVPKDLYFCKDTIYIYIYIHIYIYIYIYIYSNIYTYIARCVCVCVCVCIAQVLVLMQRHYKETRESTFENVHRPSQHPRTPCAYLPDPHPLSTTTKTPT